MGYLIAYIVVSYVLTAFYIGYRAAKGESKEYDLAVLFLAPLWFWISPFFMVGHAVGRQEKEKKDIS